MSKEPIHSGHFMTSNPHTEIQVEDEDEDVEVDVVDVDDSTNIQTIEKRSAQDEKPVTFYKFGPHKAQSIAIDVSLNKLNKCIKVAYMKMTTPKWKDFKGLKLQWKHRIRLNNVIWRAYYMEFRKPDKKKKTPYCYFAVPDDDTTHTKIEGSVLEGMYWKRRMEGVCAQYKRWRTYNRHAKKKPRGCCRKRENSCGCERSAQINMPPQSQTPQLLFSNDFDIDDDFDNEFTNSLFDSLNAPFIFPNPKESIQTGNADIIQPGLLSLQPSIEEIMQSMVSDYPFSDGQGSEGLAAFIDRVSQDQEPTTSESSLPQSQHQAYLPQTTSSGSLSRRLLHNPADTNNNSNAGSRGNSNLSNSNSSVGKNLSSDGTERNNSNGSGGPYSAKEYDAANMLIDYSNQKHFAQQQQQQQQQQQMDGLLVINGSGVPEKGGSNFYRYSQKPPQQQQEQRETRANDTQTPFSLVNAHTPQPLYSQAFYGMNNDVLANSNNSGGGSGLGSSGAASAPGQVGRNDYFENFVGNQPRRRLPMSQDQQQQFSPVGLATTSSQISMPTTFRNLSQHGQLLISSNNNNVFFTTSPNTVPSNSSLRSNNSSSSSMLTLDQYVLAAAAASVSTSATAAVISSLSSSMSSGGTALNSSGATTQQLAQQPSAAAPQWWMNSHSQPQHQQQYNDEQKTLQFLRSPFSLNVQQPGSQNFSVENIQKSINDANLNPAQQRHQQLSPFTAANNPTTAVITLLQNAQQQRSSPLLQLQQSQQPPQHGLKASLEAREKLLAQNSFAQQRAQQQQHNNGLLSPSTTQIPASTVAQDLSRFLPTNIGISTPSSTSMPTISLPNMLSAAPSSVLNVGETSSLPLRYNRAQNQQQNSTNYSSSTLANAGNATGNGNTRNVLYSGSGNNDIPSAAILQFHEQCQQQQQQQQQQAYMPQTRSMSSAITSVAISMSSPTASLQSALHRNQQQHHQQKFESMHMQPTVQSTAAATHSVIAVSTPTQIQQQQHQLSSEFTPPQQQQEKLPANGGSLAAHLSGKMQRPFPKAHTKKYSQPNGSRTSSVAQTKPSTSGGYQCGSDGFAAPPYLKRRSNLSESLSLDNFQTPATARNFALSAQASSTAGRWNSYDSSDTVRNHSHPPLSLLTHQQHPHQQEHQMLSPPIIGTPTLKEDYTQASAFSSPNTAGGVLGVSAPLTRQRQSSASSTSSSSMTTKNLLGINNRMAGVDISISPSSASPPPPQFHIFQATTAQPQHQAGIQQQQQQQTQQIPHYTEMTNVIPSSRRGAPAAKKSLGSLNAATTMSPSISANSAAGGGGAGGTELMLMDRARSTSLSTLTTVTGGDKSHTGSNSSASSQFLGETGSGMEDNLSPSALFGVTAVKEESEDQQSPSRFSLQDSAQQQKALIPSGSKRRNTMSGVLNVGSRSAPADSTLHPEERKRILHLHAEKNRRSALKEGFDALVEVIPFVEQAGVKSTNAVVLNRAATHMRSLKKTSEDRVEQVQTLKQKIAHLNEKISLLQSNLPSSSRAADSAQQTMRDGSSNNGGGGNAPSMRGQIEQFFERYTKERSKDDYRFWLMSEIFSPIVQSYAESIHANSSERERVAVTARQWLDRCWNASVLRPLASETLVRVATASGAFTEDNAVPKYIMSQIEKST